MTESLIPPSESSLDPTAPVFTIPAQSGTAVTTNGTSPEPTPEATQTDESQTTKSANTTPEASKKSESGSKSSKKESSTAKTAATAENIAEAGAGVKLTGAQLKKQKAAEKAARRAEKVASKGEQAQEEQSQPVEPPQHASGGGSGAKGPSNNKKNEQQQLNHKRRPSGVGTPEPGVVRIPIRPAGPGPTSTAQGATSAGATQTTSAPKGKTQEKRVPFLAHLYPSSTSKRTSVAGAHKDIHPAVLTLGLQLRDFVVCGANARTVATLLVLKKVIQAYVTPPNSALSRHLATVLSHQIGYLSQARPLGVAQGNSIRWLKKLISQLNIDLSESEAKKFLCEAIDMFVRDKITLADELIAREAAGRIEEEGEVILTYGKSSVVEKTLLQARKDGKRFRVIVVDSRPLFEGKNLVKSLLRSGFSGSEHGREDRRESRSKNKNEGAGSGCSVQYTLLHGLSDAISQESPTKCFLGGAAMLSNGRLSSRAGTAMVACMIKTAAPRSHQPPVIALCESIKFTSKVALDSIVSNELADPDILVEYHDPGIFTSTKPTISEQDSKKGGGGKKKGGGGGEDADADVKGEPKGIYSGGALEDWKEKQGLHLVNLMYDVTPAEYLDMVISELGSLPPTAAPVVNAVYGGDE